MAAMPATVKSIPSKRRTTGFNILLVFICDGCFREASPLTIGAGNMPAAAQKIQRQALWISSSEMPPIISMTRSAESGG